MNILPFLLPCILVAVPAPSLEFRAPNGLRVILDERHEQPLVRFELRVPWEGREDSASMCAVLGHGGAGGFSRTALEQALADRGLKMNLEAGRHSLAWSMLTDSQDQEDAFEFFAHALFRPALAEGITALRQATKEAASPEESFLAVLGLPTGEGALPKLDLPGCLALHRRLVRPERAVLIIQGDLNLPQARQLVMLHLGTWAPAPEPSPQGQELPEWAFRQAIPGEGAFAWAGSLPPEGEAPARTAHVLVSFLLERAFRETGESSIRVEAPRPLGDAGPILFQTLLGKSPDPEGLLRTKLERLGARGFSLEELEVAKGQWRAERSALALHPEAYLSAWTQGCLFGDPGATLDVVRLEEVNAALRVRLSTLHWLVKGH